MVFNTFLVFLSPLLNNYKEIMDKIAVSSVKDQIEKFQQDKVENEQKAKELQENAKEHEAELKDLKEKNDKIAKELQFLSGNPDEPQIIKNFYKYMGVYNTKTVQILD